MVTDQHLPLILLADNAPEILRMHWELIWWRTGAPCLRCYPAAWTPHSTKDDVFSEGIVWCRWEFVGVVVFPYQRGCMTHAEVSRSISRLANWMDGLVAHAPWFTKLLRTVSDEQIGSWYSPGTKGWYRWWEWYKYSEDKLRYEDLVNALDFSS